MINHARYTDKIRTLKFIRLLIIPNLKISKTVLKYSLDAVLQKDTFKTINIYLKFSRLIKNVFWAI